MFLDSETAPLLWVQRQAQVGVNQEHNVLEYLNDTIGGHPIKYKW